MWNFNYSITRDQNTNFEYVVMLEDEFGAVPLFGTDSFDEAKHIVIGLPPKGSEPLCWTNQTEQLMAAL